jgi:ABC-type glycerol-3-phosphate transport system substrate-binding protein
MSKFQLILLVAFGGFIIIAVMLFSFYRSSGSNQVATIQIWGDISAEDFNSLVNNAGLNNDHTLVLQYSYKNPTTFDSTFTEALALGGGPDLILINQGQLYKEKNKITVIPYSSISQKSYSSTFIDESDLFLSSTGVYALPISVDPIVLYYNKDLLSKAAYAFPPLYWDQMYDYANKLTTKDAAGNIIKSTIALGESSNIPNSKDILALLMIQAGTPITDIPTNSSTFTLQSELSNSFGLPQNPAVSALDFYTQFTNPAKPFYSWNRSLRSADTNFASGDSALYVGYASELGELRAKSPTLNIGVSPVPQSRVSGKMETFGELRGVAISRGSKNPSAALRAIFSLVSSNTSLALSKITGLPPARRDLLSNKPTDSFGSVFYDSAIQSHGWIDPDNSATARIFSNMIGSVTSGRARTDEAVSTANDQINALIK